MFGLFIRIKTCYSKKQKFNMFEQNQIHYVSCNDNTADLCFMVFVMHHLNSKDKSRDLIMREIYKCLKPNGLYVVMQFGNEFMASLSHGHGHSHACSIMNIKQKICKHISHI
eukprot:280515_1